MNYTNQFKYQNCKYSSHLVRIHKMLFGLLLFGVTLTSCKKFLDIDPPKTGLISETVFSSDATSTAAISSVYSKMTGSFLGGGSASLIVLNGLASDELLPVGSSTAAVRDFYNNNLTSVNTYIAAIWSTGYNIIYQCNAILEGLANSTNVTVALKKHIEGEALFIRAYTHLHLSNLFGNIPYIIGTDYRQNSSVSRLPRVPQVLDNITQDLSQAKEKLANDYSFSRNERVRVNKWVASALLARVYLYKGDWVNAEAQATEVLNNTGLYGLISNLNDIFLKNSREAIWQWMPGSTGQNSAEGAYFILTGSPNIASLSSHLVNQFESGDNRRIQWVGSYTSGANTWYFPYKYKLKNPTASSLEYSMIIRLAELYLIRSEARANQNKFSEAIADLDMIRGRAGLPLVAVTNPSISKSALLLIIEKERLSELFTENQRWYDLNRTGRADNVIGSIKSTWQPTDKLFPLPESELLINPMLLPQNPGY